jgi:hypothetical protein
MTGDDMFRLFQANANGMEEFARLAGESSQARTRVLVADVPLLGLPLDEPLLAEEIPEVRRVATPVTKQTPMPVAKPVALPVVALVVKRPWWERVGLIQSSKKSRRRLVRPPSETATRATGT